jgi:hypothetical protein
MASEILYIDVGSAVTTARAVKVSGDSFETHSFSVCPSPPPTGDDLTSGISPALEAVRQKMARKGSAFDPKDIMVTLSAGGEPRTVCAGVVKGISGESAKRAALSAGATVADLIAVDDGRQDFERVSDLRRQEISMVVLAGGVDEQIFQDGKHQLLNIAKVIADGLPRKRDGSGRVPLVYAASAEGREEVTRIFGGMTEIIWAENVRATLEQENLDSARNAVVGAFEESVRLDPRFKGLGRLGAPPAWPTGYAIGTAIEEYHRRSGENLLVISLNDGVQVLSAIRGVFTRTVTPVERVDHRKVLRHLPSDRLAQSTGDMLGNWKLHPHLIPCTWDELAVFLAFWKEAVSEAMEDHKNTSIELRGVHRQREISETFQVSVAGGDTLVRMERISRIIFTGYLSRLMSPASLVSIAADGTEPCGITGVFLDPGDALQLAGMLIRSGISPRFEEALRPLGILVSPGRGQERVTARRAFTLKGQTLDPLPVKPGEIAVVTLQGVAPGLEVVVDPPNSKVDLGDGDGRRVRAKVHPGAPAIYLDGRARIPVRPDRVAHEVQKWYRNLRVFPDDVISAWAGGKQ